MFLNDSMCRELGCSKTGLKRESNPSCLTTDRTLGSPSSFVVKSSYLFSFPFVLGASAQAEPDDTAGGLVLTDNEQRGKAAVDSTATVTRTPRTASWVSAEPCSHARPRHLISLPFEGVRLTNQFVPDIHVTESFCQDGTGLFHSPVCGSMKRSPAIMVLDIELIASLN